MSALWLLRRGFCDGWYGLMSVRKSRVSWQSKGVCEGKIVGMMLFHAPLNNLILRTFIHGNTFYAVECVFLRSANIIHLIGKRGVKDETNALFAVEKTYVSGMWTGSSARMNGPPECLVHTFHDRQKTQLRIVNNIYIIRINIFIVNYICNNIAGNAEISLPLQPKTAILRRAVPAAAGHLLYIECGVAKRKHINYKI